MQNTGGVITDTLNWILVSGSFEAQGGERFITIGNFYADSNTTVVPVQGGMYNFAYYYIDDVSVVDCTVGLEEIRKEKRVMLYPNPSNENFTVELNLKEDETAVIFIKDLFGKVVLIKDVTGPDKRIVETTATRAGVYFYEIVVDGILKANGKLAIIH